MEIYHQHSIHYVYVYVDYDTGIVTILLAFMAFPKQPTTIKKNRAHFPIYLYAQQSLIWYASLCVFGQMNLVCYSIYIRYMYMAYIHIHVICIVVCADK